jgi:hypothetical protein
MILNTYPLLNENLKLNLEKRFMILNTNPLLNKNEQLNFYY